MQPTPQMDAMLDTIAAGLAKQRAVSRGPEDLCVYRSPSGEKCAVGMIIPDELYEPNMESRGVSCLLSASPALQDYWLDKLEIDPLTKAGVDQFTAVRFALAMIQAFHDSGRSGTPPDGITYEGMLEDHVDQPEEVLATAIKVRLVQIFIGSTKEFA